MKRRCRLFHDEGFPVRTRHEQYGAAEGQVCAGVGYAYLHQRQPGRAQPLAIALIYHDMSIHSSSGMEQWDGHLPCCRRLEKCLWLRRDTQGHSGPEGTWAEGSHCVF